MQDYDIRLYARAEVDLARVGGSFPDQDTRTQFEMLFDAIENWKS